MATIDLKLLAAELRDDVAVVDTNVIVDMFTTKDLETEYMKLGDAQVEQAARTRGATFRRARQRESLLLGWYLHKERATTFHVVTEALRIMRRVADPDAVHEFGTHFTTHFVHFIKDRVLADWNDRTVPTLGEGLKGAEIDDLLIEICRASGLPLITNEGYSESGVSDADPKKLRAKAIAARIPVFTPRQFWINQMTSGRAERAFIRRMDDLASGYLHGRSDSTREALLTMRGYFQHVFYGLTPKAERLSVEL
jgi:hypothetical protein